MKPIKSLKGKSLKHLYQVTILAFFESIRRSRGIVLLLHLLDQVGLAKEAFFIIIFVVLGEGFFTI